MSALGQKQTCAAQKVMSALPPTATVKADSPKVMSALTPKADMCAALRMSAMGQKRTWVPYSINSSARERSVYGTVRPRDLAVVRLIIN
jgi:hypothetical protein